jgi:hypothetical protein
VELSGNRRAQPRVRSSGTATIQRASGERAEFAIRDMSANGALLVGCVRLVAGELVRVSLDLEGLAVQLVAAVVRTDPENAQAAIAFRAVTCKALRSFDESIDRMIRLPSKPANATVTQRRFG